MQSLPVLACLLGAAAAVPTFNFAPASHSGYGHAKTFFTVSHHAVSDCVYSDWVQWSPCSGACETTGFSSRSRVVLEEAFGYGSAACDERSLEEWRDCLGEPCAADCAVSNWAAWGACDKACGSGLRHRARGVVSNAVGGGAPCGFLEEVEECSNGACAADCVQSQWQSWSRCSANCGPGRRDRSRFVQSDAFGGGIPCGPSEEWESCDSGPCARDCAYNQWAPWSSCPSCGAASRSRSRNIAVEGAFGGITCDFGSLTESEACPFISCAVDCQMSFWASWTRCSANTGSNCGPGKRSRTRAVQIQAQNGGRPCESTEEWESCDSGPCARDCAYGQWQSWSSCPSCGAASRSRSRQIVTNGEFGGITCDFGALNENEACPFISCAVDCIEGQWAEWSRCDVNCGSGRRSRYRSIVQAPQNGGRQCGQKEEWESCNAGQCARDCAYDQWQSWSSCPSCGVASRSRSRQIVAQGAFGGVTCDFGALSESEACPFTSCAVDCVMAFWSEWTRCSADCGAGRRSRTRGVITYPNNGGRQCGQKEEWESCDSGPCARDCAYNQWAPWGSCPSCGAASRSRSRSIAVEGAFGGVTCDFGSLSETEACPFISCAVDCRMEAWTSWTRCSADCGSGKRSRTRGVATFPSNGGRQCGPQEEWEDCSNGPCVRDCVLGNWAQWSDCCGAGVRSRWRQISQEPLGPGAAPCGSLDEIEKCQKPVQSSYRQSAPPAYRPSPKFSAPRAPPQLTILPARTSKSSTFAAPPQPFKFQSSRPRLTYG